MDNNQDRTELFRPEKVLENVCTEPHHDLDALMKKLNAKRAKSEPIFAAIGDPMVIIDTQYRVLYQNKLAEELFGEQIGQYCHVAYQKSKEPCPECALARTWQDGKIHKIEKSMANGYGVKYVEVASSPLTDSAGKMVAGIEIVRDITKRKLAEQKLQKSNSLLQAVLESTADGILAVDRNGTLLSFNQKFAKIWKIPPHLLADYEDDVVLEFVLRQVEHPEAFLQKVKELYRSPDATDLDVISRKDGRSIERYTRPLIINGSNKGRVWSFRDITQLNQAEEERLKLVRELQEALAEVKRLSGFLPICSHCKKIRDCDGHWIQLETYISRHSEAVFSHGICPECVKIYHPKEYNTIYPEEE